MREILSARYFTEQLEEPFNDMVPHLYEFVEPVIAQLGAFVNFIKIEQAHAKPRGERHERYPSKRKERAITWIDIHHGFIFA